IQNTFDQLTQYTIIDATAPDGTAYKTVDTTQIIGMLASDWAMDGAKLNFTLGNNATYHNGDPVDAAAMKTGYDRIMESAAISSPLLGMGGAITGADNFTANDDGTFTITMSVPNTLVPQNNVMHNTSALDPAQIAEVATDDDPWGLEFFKANLG